MTPAYSPLAVWFTASDAAPPTLVVIDPPLLPLSGPTDSDWPLRSSTPPLTATAPVPRARPLPTASVPDDRIVPPV